VLSGVRYPGFGDARTLLGTHPENWRGGVSLAAGCKGMGAT